MRPPLSLPERSALNAAVRSPVISVSGAVWPEPFAFTAWLLVMDAILVVTLLHWSVAVIETSTGIHLWLGGQRTSGVTEAERITGGIVSIMATVTVQVTGAVTPSETETTTVLVPNGYMPESVMLVALVEVPAATVFVCTATPFAVHTTVNALPLASETTAVSVTGVPSGPAHSAFVDAGQTSVGPVLAGTSCPRISPLVFSAVTTLR